MILHIVESVQYMQKSTTISVALGAEVRDRELNDSAARSLCESGFGLHLVHPMKAMGLSTLKAGCKVSKVGWWKCYHV